MTVEQPTLPQVPPAGRRLTLDEEFALWADDNERVVALFIRYALAAKRSGKKVGAKAVWERLRWELHVESTGDGPRLNNNYTALVARVAMEREPELRGFFDTRERRAGRS